MARVTGRLGKLRKTNRPRRRYTGHGAGLTAGANSTFYHVRQRLPADDCLQSIVHQGG